MKSLTLQRDDQDSIRTLGSITDESETLVVPDTLELPWLNNQHDVSCIPAGTYTCEYTNHPKHGWVYQVMAVPGRDAILLHVGNYPTDTEGCILLGQTRELDAIGDSKTAFNSFMKYMAAVPIFTLVVVDPPLSPGA